MAKTIKVLTFQLVDQHLQKGVAKQDLMCNKQRWLAHCSHAIRATLNDSGSQWLKKLN